MVVEHHHHSAVAGYRVALSPGRTHSQMLEDSVLGWRQQQQQQQMQLGSVVVVAVAAAGQLRTPD